MAGSTGEGGGESPLLRMAPAWTGIAMRTLAATIGAYALASALAMALARTLPLSRAEATCLAAMVAVLAMPAAVIWAFAARTVTRAWGVMLPIIALGFLAAWLMGSPA